MALWTPAEISSALWLDASDPSTITIDTGISEWRDKSGNARHATQSVAAKQPTVTTGGLNGLDVVHTNGAQGFAISVPQTRPCHVFAVVNTTDLQTGYRLFLNRSSAGIGLYIGKTDSDPAIYWGAWVLDSEAKNTAYISEWYVGADTIGMRQDGQTAVSAANTNTALTTWSALVDASVQQPIMDIAEVLIVNEALTDDDRQKVEGYLAHKWGTTASLPADHPYKSVAPTIGAEVRNSLVQGYDLELEILKQYINQKYNILDIIKQYLDQRYGEAIVVYLAAYYGDAPAIRTFLEQRYQDSKVIMAILNMSYEDLLILRTYLEQPYQFPQAFIAMLEQKYGINEAELIAMLEQKYDISIRNYITTLLNQVYGLQGDRNVDYINTGLTINGKTIPIYAASGECSIDSFCITIDVIVADYNDYLNINIDDPAIFANGEDVYSMIVDSKQRTRSGVANTAYHVFLISPRIDLQSPRNKTFTEEYPAGNAQTIAETIIGENIDWQTVGFPILDNKLYANDETKIDIVRKIIRTVGAKLQSNPDGTLRVIPEYPIPVNKWESPDYFMTDTVDFVSQSESFNHNTGFNRFIVRNENIPEDRIWIEQEEVSAYEKKILAFQTPWDTDAQFELIHSGGTPVPAPIYYGVVEVTQPAEQVEFIAGFANTMRPIYGNLQVVWLRENLGNITFSEDGKLEAELKTGTTDGYSLAKITYTTKYHLWHVADLLDEDIQYILREITNE